MMDNYTPYNNDNENEIRNREFSTDSNTKRSSKKRVAALMAANLMAMALVSAGTVGIYRAVEKKDSDTKVVTEYVDKSGTASANISPMGLIDMAAAEENGGLTTESVVQKLLPSVVGITSEFEVTSQQNSFEDFFGFGYGYGGQQNQQPSTQTAKATGTGVVISDEGYVVTNAHVIYDTEHGGGLSKKISVILNDDSSYDAEVIGYDTSSDLAVLKIEADDLTAAEFGDSDALQLGESVVAIGNPLGFRNTVTTGVVSGKDRTVSVNDESLSLLQTDAAINSGNSGGPLINKYGKVIGINSSKMSSSYSQSEASIDNIGFAIPSNDVARIVKDLIDNGHITTKCKLGISCRDVDESMANAYNLPVGVYVIKVNEDSAAEEAGLCYGDIITAVDGVAVKNVAQLNNQKNKHEPGDTIELTITRSGKEQTVKLVLDEADEEEPSSEASSEADDGEDTTEGRTIPRGFASPFFN